MKEPILITGASRSGSSMIAGILNICGVFGGTLSFSEDSPEKGMFENIHIKHNIIDSYFKNAGYDHRGQFPLPKIEELQIPLDWRAKIETIIKKDGYISGEWMYKSSRACLVWPIFDYAFPNAKWIIVRRKDEDIVHSCLKTTFMNAFDSELHQKLVNARDKEEAWYWWVRQHNRRFVEMIEAGLNCKQIHPERMLNGDYSQIYEMLEWLGLKWNSKIPNYIEPKFFKVRNKK